jgi:DNA invertase Pin-like site-specific DNA recombinase
VVTTLDTISKRIDYKDAEIVRRLIQDHCVEVNGCWIWTRSTRGKGYAQMTLSNRKQVYGHRASYMVNKGAIPDGGVVCHSCDEPRCCNPDHLFLGTQKDNMQDCVAKGRLRPGRVGAPRKVSDEQRKRIAELRSQGMLQRQIAQQFGITQVRVSQLLKAQSCQ